MRFDWSVACASCLLGAQPALGADPWEPIDDRILADPAFLPLAGEVEGSFSYDYNATNYDFVSGPGAFPQHLDKSFNTFVPFLSYGITDDVSVSAELPFGNERIRNTYTYERAVFPPRPAGFGPPAFVFPTFVPTTAHSDSRGLGAQNPSFQAVWRAVDQSAAPVNIDLSAFYAPDIFVARDPEPGQAGTVASGGASGGMALAVSREMQAFTARVHLDLDYEGRQDVHEESGQQVAHNAARPSYQIGVQTQTRATPWLAFNAGVSAEWTPAVRTGFPLRKRQLADHLSAQRPDRAVHQRRDPDPGHAHRRRPALRA